MRILYALIIVMIPTLVEAQVYGRNARDTWNCTGIAVNGYSWNGVTWERRNFASRSWEFTFAGNSSRQSINGERVPFSCTNDQIIKQCSYQGLYFMFNTETKRGALADLFGVAINPDNNPQVFIELVECARDAFEINTDIAAPPESLETALETRLRELEKLKNDGVISEQEYQRARSAALGL